MASKNLITFISKTPYSGEDSFAALSNVFSCIDKGFNCIIIFIFDGVWNTIPNQKNDKVSNFPSIEDLYKTIITEAKFYVHEESLKNRIDINQKLLPGIKEMNNTQLSQLIFENGQNIIYF